MLDLEELVLNESFDSVEGFEVVNLKPNSNTPQTFLIKNGEDNNLVLSMFALNGNGDKIRALKATDKNVIVELMTVNENGFLRELKGGVGSNPMKTIVTIFDTVYNNLNLPIVDSVTFRFQPRKLQGKAPIIMRILERLAMTRGKGRFVSLPEMADYSKKYSYVVMHKRRVDLDKLPGAANVSDQFKKVETSAGEVYVDDKTGKQVSKSDVAAQAIAGSLSKISSKEPLLKTKVSKLEVMTAQYGKNKLTTSSQQKAFNDIVLNPPVKKADSSRTANLSNFDTVVDLSPEPLKGIRHILDELNDETKNIDGGDMYTDAYFGYVAHSLREMKVPQQKRVAVFNRIVELKNQLTLNNSYDTLKKAANIYTDVGITEDFRARNHIVAAFVASIKEMVGDIYRMTENHITKDTPNFKAKSDAIADYANYSYSDVNGYLNGTDLPNARVTNLIKNLDQAFDEDYVKLPKNTKVYRSMNLPSELIKTTFESKIFYFRNYVSTSLQPIIFSNSFGFTVAPHITSDVNDTDTSAIPDVLRLEVEETMSVGLVISGADKLNVLIPFKLAKYPSEAEVILPRGTAVRFDRVTRSKTVETESVLVDCTVIDPDVLSEDTQVYDGDALVESGEIKLLEDDRFVFSKVIDQKNKFDQDLRDNNAADACCDLYVCNHDIPHKFRC